MPVAPADILHLAEPLRGIADGADGAVADLLAGAGDRLGNLSRIGGPDAVAQAVASARPDYVLLGQCPEPQAMARLAQAVRTSALGLVVLREDMAGPCPAPQIEIEVLGAAPDLNGFALRLRGLMRRCRPVALSGRCRAGDLLLDEAAMTLAVDGAVATLSLEDFRLLGPLFDLPGRVWPREDLLRLAYGARTANAARTVDVKLNRTRRRLRAALGRDPIRSVRGLGYALAPGMVTGG